MRNAKCLLGLLCSAAMLGLGVGCSPTSSHAVASTAGSPTSSASVGSEDTLVQFSLIAALASGDYEHGAPLRQVLESGDFGIGTFDRLDGEMIVLDGQMFQALGNGTLRPANLDSTTPFAAVTCFCEDGRIANVSAATLEDLDEQLDRKLPRRNTPYAIRIEGTFRELTLRSVPAQSPPFEPLVNVVKHQSTWKRENVQGTLVGFRCPAWMKSLNVPGYHWHFLSDDRQIGGHVLACDFQDALLKFDECTAIKVHLPESPEFNRFDADQIKQQDINQIERQRK
ncbi:acetolactate decarboxylase [Anatilimnocola sp. NA78]|uniref:acetolactate decarboxylase n=1 Tax=Anatilimnocola sp. NA78 TaxID=3415683 RepID=UPI003CE46A13